VTLGHRKREENKALKEGCPFGCIRTSRSYYAIEPIDLLHVIYIEK
jgi:hypothetical protein